MEEQTPEQQSLRRRFAWLAPDSLAPTFVGIGVAIVGFVLIAVAWGEVASKTNVALQVPYVVSGGLTGLGLIMVGLLAVNIAAKRRDAAERARQMEQLASIVRDLKRAIES